MSPVAIQAKLLKKICLVAVLFVGLVAFLNAAEPGHEAAASPAAAEGQAEPQVLPSAAETVFHIGPLPVTNFMLVTWIVAVGLIVFA